MTAMYLARRIHKQAVERMGLASHPKHQWGALEPWARDEYIAAAELAIQLLTPRKRKAKPCQCAADLFGGG